MNRGMIDQDNLNMKESVGTFRWNSSTTLIPAPAFIPEYRGLLQDLEKGW